MWGMRDGWRGPEREVKMVRGERGEREREVGEGREKGGVKERRVTGREGKSRREGEEMEVKREMKE